MHFQLYVPHAFINKTFFCLKKLWINFDKTFPPLQRSLRVPTNEALYTRSCENVLWPSEISIWRLTIVIRQVHLYVHRAYFYRFKYKLAYHTSNLLVLQWLSSNETRTFRIPFHNDVCQRASSCSANRKDKQSKNTENLHHHCKNACTFNPVIGYWRKFVI